MADLLLGDLKAKPFQPSVTFHIENIHLICGATPKTNFRIECNTELRWANWLSLFG